MPDLYAIEYPLHPEATEITADETTAMLRYHDRVASAPVGVVIRLLRTPGAEVVLESQATQRSPKRQ